MKKLIKNFIDFHKKAEKLKITTRHSWLTNSSRQESTAEHTWMLCLLAIIVSDKLTKKAVMQHNLADIKTWEQGDFDHHPYYQNEFFNFDIFMRTFKDIVDVQSMKKIIAGKAEHRIHKKYLARYRGGK